MNNKNMRAARYMSTWVVLLILPMLAIPLPALATTLPAALTDAYLSNPDLLAVRAGLRVTVEEVAAARSGYPRPWIVEQRDQQLEAINAQVLAGVEAAWAQLDAARAAENATQSQIESAQLARDGKLNELEVGLVTTLDVLNAHQDVLAAALVSSGAQRDSVLAGYSLLAATGRLHSKTLGLSIKSYEPSAHFDAVNRQWSGTRSRYNP